MSKICTDGALLVRALAELHTQHATALPLSPKVLLPTSSYVVCMHGSLTMHSSNMWYFSLHSSSKNYVLLSPQQWC